MEGGRGSRARAVQKARAPMPVTALLLSVLVGLSLGLLGGGGSILTVPILLYAVGLEEKAAIATSLLVVGITSAVAAVAHARRGNVDWRTGLVFAAAGASGAFLGGLVADAVAGPWLIRGFIVMMLGTAFAMIRGRREEAAVGTFAIPKVLATGAGLGLLTGMVGAGGGFVIVPALVLVGGLPMRRAVGTSLVVIAVQSLAGFAGHATHVAVDVRLAAEVTGAAVVGSLFGGAFAAKVPATVLRRGFGVFVLLMAAFMAARQGGAG